MNQQRQHHLGACWNADSQAPWQTLSQNLHFNRILSTLKLEKHRFKEEIYLKIMPVLQALIRVSATLSSWTNIYPQLSAELSFIKGVSGTNNNEEIPRCSNAGIQGLDGSASQHSSALLRQDKFLLSTGQSPATHKKNAIPESKRVSKKLSSKLNTYFRVYIIINKKGIPRKRYILKSVYTTQKYSLN